MRNKWLVVLVCVIVVALGVAAAWGWFWNPKYISAEKAPEATLSVQELVATEVAKITKDEKPLATATPTETEQKSVANTGCRVIHESVIVAGQMNHVSTSGSFLHVEFWVPGQPERETILDASKASGGRYNFSRTDIAGWVWEYAGCSYEQVLEQVTAHIPRRIAGGANNDGYVKYEVVNNPQAWHPSVLFIPVPFAQ
jgi:hypothetical protein